MHDYMQQKMRGEKRMWNCSISLIATHAKTRPDKLYQESVVLLIGRLLLLSLGNGSAMPTCPNGFMAMQYERLNTTSAASVSAHASLLI